MLSLFMTRKKDTPTERRAEREGKRIYHNVDAIELGACLAVGAVYRLGLTFASARRVLLPSEDVFLAALGLGD